MLALPGCAYIYQGEELGLPQVEDLPDEVLQDPAFLRSGGETRGARRLPGAAAVERHRAAVRVLAAGVTPWLPQPKEWASLTAEAQAADPDSTLSMYRNALRLRREVPGSSARTSPGGRRRTVSSTSNAATAYGAWSTWRTSHTTSARTRRSALQQSADPRRQAADRHGSLAQEGA